MVRNIVDLTRVGSPHEVGDWVRLDFGDFYLRGGEPVLAHDGEQGVVIGKDYHDHNYHQHHAPDPSTRSIDVIKLNSGSVVRVHWVHVRRMSPLEALGAQVDS